MSTEALDRENDMKTYLLITDTNNLSHISSIIESKKELKIQINQFSLNICTHSIQKIMKLSSQLSEEMIQLLLDGKVIRRLSTKNNTMFHSSQEDDEDSFKAEISTQAPRKYILDSEDINQEEHINIKEESYLSHKDGKFFKNHDEALAYAKQIRQKKHDDMVNRIYNQRRKEYDNWANSNDTSTWDADNAFRSEPDYDQIEREVYNKLGY